MMPYSRDTWIEFFSFKIMSLHFTHDIMDSLFLFIAKYYSTVWLYLHVFIHSSVDGPPGYFFPKSTKIKVHGYYCANISESLRYIPSRIMYSVICIHKKLAEFPKDEPLHILTKMSWNFQLFFSLASVCLSVPHFNCNNFDMYIVCYIALFCGIALGFQNDSL